MKIPTANIRLPQWKTEFPFKIEDKISVSSSISSPQYFTGCCSQEQGKAMKEEKSAFANSINLKVETANKLTNTSVISSNQGY